MKKLISIILLALILTSCTGKENTPAQTSEIETTIVETTVSTTIESTNAIAEAPRKIDVVLSTNKITVNGTNFKVNVEMIGGTKEFGTVGYDETDMYKGDFYIVSYDSSGKKLSEYKLKSYVNDYELYFTTLFSLEISDYNSDNNPDFTIGQRYVNNFSLHHIYSIDSNGIISNLFCWSGKELGFDDTIPIQGNIPSVLLNKENTHSFSSTWYTSAYIPTDYLDELSTKKWFEDHPVIYWVKDYYQWNGDSFIRIKSIPVDVNGSNDTFIEYPVMTSETPDFNFDEPDNLTFLSESKTEYSEIKECDNSLAESEIPSNVLTAAKNCLKSSDKYIKTTEELKKSNGCYILGSYVMEAKTNEKSEPDIKVEDAVFVPCGSETGYFISMSYLDLAAAFTPYDTR